MATNEMHQTEQYKNVKAQLQLWLSKPRHRRTKDDWDRVVESAIAYQTIDPLPRTFIVYRRGVIREIDQVLVLVTRRGKLGAVYGRPFSRTKETWGNERQIRDWVRR